MGNISKAYEHHGHSPAGKPSGTYTSWQSMRDRCANPRAVGYENYGGRGIRVCERWRASFVAFLEDMGPRPQGATIERIDNDGHYERGNCRWATRAEQNANTRQNVFVAFRGKSMTVAEWAREIGCNEGALRHRFYRGMAPERALTEPFDDFVNVRRRNNNFNSYTLNGETLTLWQWAERTGIRPQTLRYRHTSGWSAERALTTPTAVYTKRT